MFDIGVNLTNSQFAHDRAQVIARAQAGQVSGMIVTGTNLHESEQALALACEYPDYCWSTALAEQISQLAKQPTVVALGECGLDFNRNFSTPDEQEQAFSAQLALAAELGLPVFLHCRDTHTRFMALLSPLAG